MLLHAIVDAYAPIATIAPKGINTTMANAPRVVDYSMDPAWRNGANGSTSVNDCI